MTRAIAQLQAGIFKLKKSKRRAFAIKRISRTNQSIKLIRQIYKRK